MKKVLTKKEQGILSELRGNVESTDEFNEGFDRVWLGNCDSEGTKSFSGILASLTKKGFYIPDGDAVMGSVKIEKEN